MSFTVAMLGFFFLMAMLLVRSWGLGQLPLPKRPQRRPRPEERTAASLQPTHLRD